jgi:hypothetical protein
MRCCFGCLLYLAAGIGLGLALGWAFLRFF